MKPGVLLAVVAALVGVGMTLALYSYMRVQHHQSLLQQIAAEAEVVRSELQSRMDSRVLALIRQANRFDDENPPSHRRFLADSAMVYAHYPGFQAIEWLDETGTIQWIYPIEGNETAIGFHMITDPVRGPLMRKAQEQGIVTATPIVELRQGGTGFLIFAPIRRGGDSGTFVAGAFRVEPLFDSILTAELAEGYSIDIRTEGNSIYHREFSETVNLLPQWTQRVTVQVADRIWEVDVQPSREQLAQMRSFTPELALMAGTTSSLLVGMALYLAARARHGEWLVRRANSELLDEIARRRQAEQQLRQTALQLERSNRELENFATVASHDLQEPLRKIQAFGDRLRQKRAHELGDDGRDYLARMQSAAERMQKLISDLLSFSRVSTRAQPFAPVDLSEVVRQVLSDLETRIEQTGGTVEVAPLPIIHADATQMRQLMQNLIGNALKFHRPGEPPRVRIWAETGVLEGLGSGGNTESFVRLFVQDNGIGFDEKYLDRIFGVFQRLHGRGEYEGTGIGLAVCRRIVERHHGTITARSVPNQGATFIITLPVQPDSTHTPELFDQPGFNHSPQHAPAGAGAFNA